MSGIVDELGHLAELLGDALDELPLLLRRRLVAREQRGVVAKCCDQPVDALAGQRMGAAVGAFERCRHHEIEADADGRCPHAGHHFDGEGIGLAFLLPRAGLADIGAMAVEEMAGLVRHDEDHGRAEQLLEQALDGRVVVRVIRHAERGQRQGLHAIRRRPAKGQHGRIVEDLLFGQPVAIVPGERQREIADQLHRRQRQHDLAAGRGIEVQGMLGVFPPAEIEADAAELLALAIGEARQQDLLEVGPQSGGRALRDPIEGCRRIEAAPVERRRALGMGGVEAAEQKQQGEDGAHDDLLIASGRRGRDLPARPCRPAPAGRRRY